MGTGSDAYDNGLKESIIGLFKTECIATQRLRRVDWYNHRRLHGSLGRVPPVEFEQAHYAALTPQEQPA